MGLTSISRLFLYFFLNPKHENFILVTISAWLETKLRFNNIRFDWFSYKSRNQLQLQLTLTNNHTLLSICPMELDIYISCSRTTKLWYCSKKNFQPKNMPPFYWFRTQNLIPWRQNNLQGRLCGQQLFQVVQRIISTAQCKTKISSKVRMTSEFDWFCWKLLRFENKVQNNFTSLLSKTTAADNCNGWKIIPKLHNKKKDSDSNAPDLTLIDDVLPSLARFSLVYCLVPREVPSKRLLSHLWFRPYSILPKSRQLAHHSCPLSSQSIHLSAWRLPPAVKLTGTQRRSPFF